MFPQDLFQQLKTSWPDNLAVIPCHSRPILFDSRQRKQESRSLLCIGRQEIFCIYEVVWFVDEFCVGSCHKRQKPQAPTPQAPIRNRQTRKVANAKGLNRNTNLT